MRFYCAFREILSPITTCILLTAYGFHFFSGTKSLPHGVNDGIRMSVFGKPLPRECKGAQKTVKVIPSCTSRWNPALRIQGSDRVADCRDRDLVVEILLVAIREGNLGNFRGEIRLYQGCKPVLVQDPLGILER